MRLVLLPFCYLPIYSTVATTFANTLESLLTVFIIITGPVYQRKYGKVELYHHFAF